MDKKITKKKNISKKVGYGIGMLFMLFLIYRIGFPEYKSRLTIDAERVTFSEVKQDIFQEYIVQSGEILPGGTFFLDAVEGGNVIRVVAPSGSMVKKGDAIVELTNASLRLSVLSQENSLIEQINRIRTTRLQLDQNFLSQKQAIAQIENQLQILGPQFYRDSTLFAKELISRQAFEKTQADYQYNLKRKNFTYASFKNDSTSRVLQLKQLQFSEQSMSENLKGVRKILDNLIIRAPIDGQLATIQLQQGQNINKGERIGQVDVLGTYKVKVPVDEIYLSRITKGLEASTEIAGKTYRLSITYIHPKVEGGRFDVDMSFIGEIPEDIKSGQSLRLKIELGRSSEEILLPVGGFYGSTAGKWVFIVKEGENRAIKQNILLGRKNSENYQVLEGLKPGDVVITSSYDNFGDNEVLTW